MDSTIQRDIMRLTVRGAWELLLHDNADMIDLFKEANRPAPVKNANPFYDFDKEPDDDVTAAVADEISANLENLMGPTEDTAPKAEPKHPTESTTTSKFANLQFGRNYDPNNR